MHPQWLHFSEWFYRMGFCSIGGYETLKRGISIHGQSSTSKSTHQENGLANIACRCHDRKTNWLQIWFNLDFLRTYCQFPLSTESLEFHTTHRLFGVFTPNRVLHSATNAVAYSQSSTEALFGHLDILVYFGDLLRYYSDEELFFAKIPSVRYVQYSWNLKEHKMWV